MTAAVRFPSRPGRTMRDLHLPGDTPTPPRPRRAPGRYGTGHPAQLPVCACQWGPSGHCQHGDHDRCRAAAAVGPRPETYLAYAGGPCVLDAGTPVQVWLTDRTCRWSCPCGCHTTTPEALPAAPVLPMHSGWEQHGLPLATGTQPAGGGQ